MEKIQSNGEKRENVLIEAVNFLKPILEKIKSKEKVIGQALNEAVRKARIAERIIGSCPNCGTGQLMILYSRRTRKRFIGCTNYFKGLCKTSFPLPQSGTLKPTSRECKECGWPTIQVRIKGRRPWTLCFNPQCPSRERRERRGKKFEVQNMR